MSRIACLAMLALVLASPLIARQSPPDEKDLWSLEDNYWRCVQSSDLERYRNLWHSDFLGWPLSNPEPVRKEHITSPTG